MIPKFDLLPRQCGVDLPRTWAFGSFSGSLYTASIEVRETGKGGGIFVGDLGVTPKGSLVRESDPKYPKMAIQVKDL